MNNVKIRCINPRYKYKPHEPIRIISDNNNDFVCEVLKKAEIILYGNDNKFKSSKKESEKRYENFYKEHYKEYINKLITWLCKTIKSDNNVEDNNVYSLDELCFLCNNYIIENDLISDLARIYNYINKNFYKKLINKKYKCLLINNLQK